MQKRSHALLVQKLLRSHQGFGARRYDLAFLFGSFQPDCNPLSYLKGSFKEGKTLRGHNYLNSRRYIHSRIRKLQQRSRWTIWHYYTLGKLTHYVADAYTYPHNEHFPNSMLDHHRYETDLRRFFQSYLARRCPDCLQARRDLVAALEELHRQYMSRGSDAYRDTSYILKATSLLMAACAPDAISRSPSKSQKAAGYPVVSL